MNIIKKTACGIGFCLLGTLSNQVFAQKKQADYYLKLNTDSGSCIIRLYNQTPLHRDNFLKLTKEKFYDSLLFHRVIKNFMIQGGDPDSKRGGANARLGAEQTGLGYTIPAEIKPELYHKKGALGAARTNNPEKASSASQFYIVDGKKSSDAELDMFERSRLKGQKMDSLRREMYKNIGGALHLDGEYTVFGEVIEGLDVVDRIASTKTGPGDRPLTDIRMQVSLAPKKDIKRILKADKTRLKVIEKEKKAASKKQQ